MTPGEALRHRYDALWQFLGGYLNQDYMVIHGSIEDAIESFSNDATVAERATAAAQLGELLESVTDDGVLAERLDMLGLEVDGSVGRGITERAWLEEVAAKLGYASPSK